MRLDAKLNLIPLNGVNSWQRKGLHKISNLKKLKYKENNCDIRRCLYEVTIQWYIERLSRINW